MALKNLGVKINHLFSCDVNKFAKMTIMENFPPKIFYDDVTTRDNTKVAKADLYVAGFPCQPFSMAGLKGGFEDARGRGEIFWHVRDYLEKQQPRAFVLENVSGLVSINAGSYFSAIMEALNALHIYNIYSQILNTKDHGVPHHRPRIYFVGIQRRFDDGSFSFPEPVPLPSIEFFLEPRMVRPLDTDLPPASQTTAVANVRQALREIRGLGRDPLEEPFIVDCDSSTPRMKYIEGVTPCLTCSRNRGHWVTNRMRRFTKSEMMRLQGIDPKDLRVAVPETQLGRQIGNAMSVNVLERLFARILPAAGLVRRGLLVDRWACKLLPSSTKPLAPASVKRRPSSARRRRSPALAPATGSGRKRRASGGAADGAEGGARKRARAGLGGAGQMREDSGRRLRKRQLERNGEQVGQDGASRTRGASGRRPPRPAAEWVKRSTQRRKGAPPVARARPGAGVLSGTARRRQ